MEDLKIENLSFYYANNHIFDKQSHYTNHIGTGHLI